MKFRLTTILLASACTLTSLSIKAAGFSKISVADPERTDLVVGVWYPTEAVEAATPNTEFGLSVALNASIGETNGGLILISHGYGGWYGGHADTAAALADAGYVVAAPTHTGNTWSDMSAPIEQWMLDRPRQVSRVLDHVLASERLAPHVDAGKVGVYGFSAGGYTALGLIGGIPDLELAARHCEEQPEEFVCSEGMIASLFKAGLHEIPEPSWGADTRVRAAVIAAPGFGFSYDAAALENVTADVQLWSGELDESVPTATNAASIARALPGEPETHWVDKASHFAFMTVQCREAFRQEDPAEYESVCGDAEGFDRWQFHDDMHTKMIRFFDESFE